MVDWVIETGRASRRRPARRRRLAGDARRVRGERRRDRGAGDAARNRRRRARRARGALERPRRRRARALRRHAAAHRGAAARARRDAPSRAARTRRSSAPSPTTRVSTAASSATPTAPCARWRKGRTRRRTNSAIREINSSIYVFRADALWPALEQLEPKNVQGELYLTDAIEIIAAGGGKVAAHIARRRARDGRREHARRARARGRVLRDRINEPHMLAGRHDRRPRDDVDRADGRARARRRPSSRSPYLRGRHAGRHRRGDRREHGRDRRRTSVAVRRSAPSVTFAPEPSSAIRPRRAPSWRSRTHGSATAPRCPTSRTSATPRSATDTNVGAGAITANFPHRPGQPKGRTTIGSNVRTGIHNGFVAPVEIGDGAWIAAGSVITKNVPPDALGIARPRQENKEGYAARQRDH